MSNHDMSGDDIQTFDRGEYRGEVFIFSCHAPVARKEHCCNCCNEIIEKGTKYITFTTVGIEGPGFELWKVHGECYLSGEPMLDGVRPRWRWQGNTTHVRGRKHRHLSAKKRKEWIQKHLVVNPVEVLHE